MTAIDLEKSFTFDIKFKSQAACAYHTLSTVVKIRYISGPLLLAFPPVFGFLTECTAPAACQASLYAIYDRIWYKTQAVIVDELVAKESSVQRRT